MCYTFTYLYLHFQCSFLDFAHGYMISSIPINYKYFEKKIYLTHRWDPNKYNHWLVHSPKTFVLGPQYKM